MSLLNTTLEDCDNEVLENYVREWLNENTYSRPIFIDSSSDRGVINYGIEHNLEPNIIIHDNNIVDLEYPDNKWKMVIRCEVTRIPIEYFRFGKINCAISLGENFKQIPGDLETLKGLPIDVDGFYDANWCTSLKSLKGLPKIIHGNLYLKGVNFKIEDHTYLPKVIDGNLYINIDNQKDANIIYKNHIIKGELVGNYNKFNNQGIPIKSKLL